MCATKLVLAKYGGHRFGVLSIEVAYLQSVDRNEYSVLVVRVIRLKREERSALKLMAVFCLAASDLPESSLIVTLTHYLAFKISISLKMNDLCWLATEEARQPSHTCPHLLTEQ